MLQEEWSDDFVVDNVAAAVLARHHEPEKEQALGERVQRDPEEQLVAEELQDAEQGVGSPVHEPLGVVLLRLALNSLDPAQI